MMPDIQSIFDSVAPLDGGWFYVGKYTAWTLYTQNAVDTTATLVLEALNIPSNNFAGLGNPGNIGIQVNNIQTPAYQPAPRWSPSTSYALNALIVDYNNNVQRATTPGVTGSTPPTFKNAGTTNDGTVVWTFQAAQGNSNYNSAPKSSATPAGVQIANLAAAALTSVTQVGQVLVTTPNSLYIPTDDVYVGYIRVRKAVAGTLETIVYLSGTVDS